MSITLMHLHHVQLAMPEGAEDQARAFYGTILGLTEVAKPEALKNRGGVWFEAGSLRVHLGVETPFHPAQKAHPAFQVPDLTAAITQVRSAGIEVSDRDALPAWERVYIADPFGNRIEILEVSQQEEPEE